MRRFLLSCVALGALCSAAHAQSGGLVSNPLIFPTASFATGNCIQATGPTSVASTGAPCGSGGGGGGGISGPSSSIIGAIPVWSNGTGTGLADSSVLASSLPTLGANNLWGGTNTFTIRPIFDGETPYDTGNLPGVLAPYLLSATAAETYAPLLDAIFSNGSTGNGIPAAARFQNLDKTSGVGLYPAITAGSYSSISHAGDAALIAGVASGSGQGLVISLWGAASPVGIRFDATAGLAFTGASAFAARPLFNGATPWDSANLPSPLSSTTAAATYLPLIGGTLTGMLTGPSLALNAAAGTWRPLEFNTAGSQRWQIGADNNGESGANSGSDFDVFSYADNGGVLANNVHITRATGVATFSVRPLFGTGVPWDSINLVSPLTTTVAAATYLTQADAKLEYLGINTGNPVLGLGPFSNGVSGNSTAASIIAESGGGSIQTVNIYPNATTGLAAAGFPSQAISSLVQAGDTAILSVANGASTFVVGAGATNDNSPAGIRFATASGGSIAMGLRPTFAGNLAWDTGNFTPSLYLTIANAAATYTTPAEVNAALAGFLTIANAATIYLTQIDAASTYASLAALSLKAPSSNPTFTGTSTFGPVTLTAAAGTWKPISFNTGGSQRWQIGSDNSSESGSNAGSNFAIFDYADNGSSLFQVLGITRSTGVANFGVRPTFAGATPWDSNNFNSSLYLTVANAASTYLTPAAAANTYLTIANAATIYLTDSNAGLTYLSKSAGGTVAGAVAFTLTPTITATPPATTDNTTKVATTAWTHSAIVAAVGTGGPYIPLTGVGLPYDIHVNFTGILDTPTPRPIPAGYHILYFTFSRKVTIPVGFVGSIMSPISPATGNVLLGIVSTGTAGGIGNLSCAAGAGKCLFQTVGGPFVFQPGDILSIASPGTSTPDPTLAGITGTIQGVISQ